jgi:hypothetical protein
MGHEGAWGERGVDDRPILDRTVIELGFEMTGGTAHATLLDA